MKSKGKKVLVIAIVLSLVTTYLAYIYLTRLEDASSNTEYINIIVATRDIPPRTVIEEDMIREIRVPKDNYIINAIQNKEEILGKYSKALIVEGEVIPRARLIEEKEKDLALRIPKNKVATSISVNEISGVADLLKPGDYVDIFITLDEISIDNGNTSTIYPKISKLLLQNIEILAVEKELNRSEGQRLESPANYSLTLAVSIGDAEKLALAEDMGRIKLALRPQGDKNNYNTPGAIREDLVPAKGVRTITR